MKKSLIALAALAAVGTASAQSSVTLSGIIKGGVAVTEYTNGPIGTRTNGSGWAVQDGSSRFIFSGVEDLGGGLKGLFQIDTRFRVDDNGGQPSSSPLASGNTFVGLGGAFGTFSLGKRDTHYCLGSDTHGSLATALQASSCGLLGYVNVGGAGINQAIANTSRSVNIVRYDTPNIAGFFGSLSVSPNFQGSEGVNRTVNGVIVSNGLGDSGKGNAYNAALNYANGPIRLGASYWKANAEDRSFGVARNDQQAYTVTGALTFGPVNVGLTYDRSYVYTGVNKVSNFSNRRNSYSIPVTFQLGNGTLLATYTRNDDTRVNGTKISDSGAWMASVGYSYSLSKRTSVGLSYVYLNNERNAAYQLYTQSSLGGFGAPLAGQDQKQLYLGFRHAF